MSIRMMVRATSILVFLCARPVCAAVLAEDFNDNELNTELWITGTYGDLTTLQERNQRLEIIFPQEELGSCWLSGQCKSRFRVGGNFDLQIDFALLDGTRFDNGGVWMEAFDGIVCANHVTFGTNYAFASEQVPTGDSSGSLRLVRSGSMATGYYYSGEEWVSLGSRQTVTYDVAVSFGYSNWDSMLIGSPLRISLDNFVVNDGQIVWAVPEPPSTLTLTLALAGLGIGLVRKRG